jgi:hypothetical protein
VYELSFDYPWVELRSVLPEVKRPRLGSAWRIAAACSAVACIAAPCLAQEAENSPFSGSVSLGARSVEVGGAETKFKEDVNLDDGVRLFDVTISYLPEGDEDTTIDRLEFDARNLGGDPFESVHFGVRKFGAYSLKLDHRRSQYFYEDTILPPALASVTGSTGGDFHHFDFERIRDTAALDIDLSPATQLSIGLEHQSRAGASTTTLDFERDEFELDRPLDESLDALTVGIRHAWTNVTLIVEEQVRSFENSSELFLPGASAGQNVSDPAELQFFMLDQSYDYDSRDHSLRLLADPTPRLNLQAGWRRDDLDLTMRASERSLGTNFAGVPASSDVSGPADVGRDIEIGTLDFGWTIGERARLVGGTRSSTLEQSGTLLFGADEGAGAWDIDTDGFELGVEVAVLPNLVATAGWSTETRETTYSHALNAAAVSEFSSTDRDGYFARLLFNTGQGFEVTASIEDQSIDDPFTLATASGSRRYGLRLRRRWDNGISVSGNHKRTDVENDLSAWSADTEQTDLRISYRRDRLDLSGGYGRVDVTRAVDRLVTAGTRQDLFAIAYEAESEFVDASARWELNSRFAVGGDLRSYDNRGSFAIARDDLRAFLDVKLSRDYTLQIQYRDLDYSEDSFDAYDAEILEVAVRLDW